jgi:hypothetical protein
LLAFTSAPKRRKGIFISISGMRKETLMDLKEIVMALEEQFWEASSAANVDLIRRYLTDDALTVGTFGVLNKESTISVNEGQPPFLFWRIDDTRTYALTEN